MNDLSKHKKDFPIFTNYPDLVYLDSASTSQKPEAVINAVSDFYKNSNANIHRGIYSLSQEATELFENSRKKIADFIGAEDEKEIVFTSGATESINFVARGYVEKFLKKDDIVVLTEMEHHSNIVPWQMLAKKLGAQILYIPVDDNGQLKYRNLNIDFKKVKLVALTHASNVLGTINPTRDIVKFFKEINPDIKILIDAAQSIPHLKINVKNLDCDFLVFSPHKMLGPTGVGVLWARKELLEKMDPMITGSHMIKKVTKESAIWADIPDKFEAGTRNIEGVIGLGAAIDYIEKIGISNIESYEQDLTAYALEKFKSAKGVRLFGSLESKNRIGVFSFIIDPVHPHDVAEILNSESIAVRSGHHCAQVLMERFNVPAMTRASLYFYNTREDIDRLFEVIEKVERVFRISGERVKRQG